MKNDELLETRVFLVKQEADRGAPAGEPDPFENKYGRGVVKPTLNPDTLLGFVGISNILPQCIRAMAENCDGFGYSLRCTVPEGDERKSLEKQIEAERNQVETFFSYVNYDMPFEKIRKEIRYDKEAIGNAWMEIIRNRKEDIDGFSYLNGASMRVGRLSKPIVVKEPRLEADTWNYETVEREKRFRLHVQLVSGKKIWFKELGDPRAIDRSTGNEMTEKMRENYERRGIEPKLANEVVHFQYSSRTSPYGVPQWLGVSPEIAGARAAAELNWYTFENQGIGQFIILLSGGQFSGQERKRIKEYIDEMGKKGRGLNQALVLEAVGQQVSPNSQTTSPCKIEIKELGITKEGVFLEYDEKSREKVRSTLRLPPILVGLAQDYSRATARESMAVAEQQVFAPARMDFDFFINRKIFPFLNVKYHEFVSNSAPADRRHDQIELVKEAVTAGLPIRQAWSLLEEALGITIDVEAIDGPWLDMPLEIVSEMLKFGLVGGPGGEKVKAPENPKPDDGGDDDDGDADKGIKSLVKVLDKMNRSLRSAA